MKFINTEVFNIRGALRGMRNPLESWRKSDSHLELEDLGNGFVRRTGQWHIGDEDMKLAIKLIKAGTEHRKFLRQIIVSVDITAPLYWWKEFDTYKVGTVANSTSTMHKLAEYPITKDCFEMDDFEDINILEIDGDLDYVSTIEFSTYTIDMLERLRLKYLQTKDKRYWKELIRWLPESWLQTRTVTMNYENILNMLNQRNYHKLTEWSIAYVNWANELPYSKELLIIEGDNEC